MLIKASVGETLSNCEHSSHLHKQEETSRRISSRQTGDAERKLGYDCGQRENRRLKKPSGGRRKIQVVEQSKKRWERPDRAFCCQRNTRVRHQEGTGNGPDPREFCVYGIAHIHDPIGSKGSIKDHKSHLEIQFLNSFRMQKVSG